jgi:hypothetical protein
MYASDELKPKEVSQLPGEIPIHSVYLTGSSGGATDLDQAPALKLLKDVLAKADKSSTMVFMGDQVDKKGYPKKDDNREQHELIEEQIKTQLSVLGNYEGTVAMLQGDLEWKYGIDEVENFEDYVDKQYGKDIVYPQNACGDPVLLEISPDIGLLIINSQWFLSDWDDYEELNEGCLVQSRAGFRWLLTNMSKGLAYKHVVVAMHHPTISRGPRGGEHGFPGLFRDGYFGPLANWFRSKLGTKQDLYSPKMEALRTDLKNIFDEHPALTFVSGHEHLLQYGNYKDHPVVGSGTAVRNDPGKIGQRTTFTAGVPGFAEIHYYESGEAWVKFTEADGSPSGKTLFEAKLYTKPKESYNGDYKLYESDQDSISYAPFVGYRKFGPIFKWAFGENNRELFTTPYTYPIFRLNEFAGGVEITKRGGGGQTNSLRITDKQGRDYVLRSIRKDPRRLLPAFARVGPLITLTQDIFFTANPFGALTAADIAEAVDIPHAYPRIVYLPAHPQLGDLNDLFADELYLLEERPNNEWIEDGLFGKPEKIKGRDDILEKIAKSYKDQVDQQALIRARLLDVLLGDFDRHNDQWRFAEYKDEKTGISKWRVIPRDRDQALLKIDGKLVKLGSLTIPAVREIQNFDDDQPWIESFTFQARMLDRRFLNELTKEDWINAAKETQIKLTDSEIEAAFDKWPKEAREGRKEEYTKAFKARRDALVKYAEKIYAYEAKEVYVVGTNADDYFDVIRHEDGTVTVDIYDYEDKKKGAKYYSRTFYPKETNSIQLFGLRNHDKFFTSGNAKNSSIKVRIIPGPEKDEVVTTDNAKAIRKRTRVYAWPGQDDLELGKETEAHITRYWRFNRYDYRDVLYDYGLWLPLFGFNPDDGVRVGLTYQENFYTFHRHYRQNFAADYATSSGGVRLTYDFSIIDLAPRIDFNVATLYQSPNFAINFFGFGNETTEISRQRQFYRTRQEIIRLAPSILLRNKNHDGGLSFTLLGESIRTDRTSGRFIESFFSSENPVFDRGYFAEAILGYSYANVDHPGFPRDGMKFNVAASLRQRFRPERATLPSAEGSMTIYQHLWKGAAFVTRVGAGITYGDFFFYDAEQLGGENLRGYRRQRFIGESQFYNQFDLRQEFAKRAFKSRIGVFASYDYGRVWNSENSDTWHYSYGGGAYIRPLSLFTMSFGYYIPEDDQSDSVLRIVLGFDF